MSRCNLILLPSLVGKVLVLPPMRRLVHMERLRIHSSEQDHSPCSSAMIDSG